MPLQLPYDSMTARRVALVGAREKLNVAPGQTPSGAHQEPMDGGRIRILPINAGLLKESFHVVKVACQDITQSDVQSDLLLHVVPFLHTSRLERLDVSVLDVSVLDVSVLDDGDARLQVRVKV